MKKLTLILTAVLIFFSCSTKENFSKFLITKIKPEKDGQTLFLKNDNGENFTTVISIPNGNFIEVNEGDKIRLEIKETLDKMNPPIILSKNIKVIEKAKILKQTFLITKIQPEKDGETLFLKNDKGEVFTTIISIPNGNFINVNTGDKISLEIMNLSNSTPQAITSNNIQIVKRASEISQEQSKIMWTGTISKQEVSFYQYGTHTFNGKILSTNSENLNNKVTLALKSDKINLDKWIEKEVIITGKKVKGYPIENGPDYVNVTQIKEHKKK